MSDVPAKIQDFGYDILGHRIAGLSPLDASFWIESITVN